ncbi:DUF3800 domain-containing protein [Clostridium perfringens]|uniref:DUF3800 domain-containing protein n=1 Tax=Clostridium perfringens TaxID=1502 RepID=UPI002247D2DF|nr:DUF3800 domain-containing protein [Clostridium perfringens]ELC8454422.1 DUF3800 domain-containing protein [Clostridium perfringens]MCX0358077.1 DUF3800 domain-containing protein [Clostridium perfringens]MCX0407758.1 DUF3800 domain-containing protein [Clostridium perfringens]MCX0418672.1 DUF3800 domain-containing protein [Clostridium perfringens]MDT7918652.1 DUF3800 domain-containing protein [Clostridium perfringens]
MINIYCDESCHLKLTDNNKEEQQIMAIGGVACDIEYLDKILRDIRKLRIKHEVFKSEMKWTKVSKGKINFYKEIIDLFFENDCLEFRVILKDKRKIYYDKYDHEEIYFIMYYYLLREMISIKDKTSIYIDKKDTKGGRRIEKLKECLCNQKLDFDQNLIEKIQIVNSKHCELLQIADVFIGAITYENRGKRESEAKVEIVEYLRKKTKLTLKKTVPTSNKKFNIFVWNGEL